MRKKKKTFIARIAKEIKRRKKLKEVKELYYFAIDNFVRDEEYLKKLEQDIERYEKR